MADWTQLGSDIDGEAANDNSGYSVSLSSDGTIVAIGAYANDGTGSLAGHVRIYEYKTITEEEYDNGNTTNTTGASGVPIIIDGGVSWGESTNFWVQQGDDIDGEATGDNSGVSVSLSDDGSIVAIGAYSNDGAGSSAGHVRVYEYSGSSWSQKGADIDGEAAGDWSGYSISLSEDGGVVAIGARLNDDAGNNAGHVRVYEWNSGTSAWVQKGSDIDGEAANDLSGYSVSLSDDGSIVAIGASSNDGTASNAGHVRVYEYSGSSWSQIGADIDGEAVGDYSGYSVSLSDDGSIVAIGAIKNDGTGTDAGHVRVYEWNGSAWVQKGGDIDGEATDDESGRSVSLSSDGTIVAIGAYLNDGAGSNAGHVRVYEYSGSSWSQKGGDIDGEAADDRSGFSVSLSDDGSIVAIGAYANDGTGNLAGHVRVYTIPLSDVLQKVITANDYINGAAIVHVSPLPNVSNTRLSQTINDNTGIERISDVLDTRFDDKTYYTG